MLNSDTPWPLFFPPFIFLNPCFFMTHSEVLYDLWAPPRLLIHLCQHFQHIYNRSACYSLQVKITVHCSGGIQVNVLHRYVSYLRLPLLSTSFSGTSSCLQRSVRMRQICWLRAGSQWTSHLVKRKKEYECLFITCNLKEKKCENVIFDTQGLCKSSKRIRSR